MAVNQIFFLGSNKYGQAGTGEKDTIKIYHSPKSYDFGVFIQQVSCGFHHSAILTVDGHVYMMGSNIHGTLATKQEGINYSFSPILVSGIPLVSKVESGSFHLCALSTEGKIYSWGRGMDGQLGTGVNKNCSTPQLVNLEQQIVDLSCGTNHSLILSSSNKAYAFGNGIYGQLGIGNNKNQPIPAKINLQNVTLVAAGDNHSMLLSNGSVYATGQNTSGQIGIGNMKKKYVLQPQKIELENVSIIQASKISAAISDGQLYVWGYKNKQVVQSKPRLIQSNEEFNEMKCGNDMVLSLSSKGDLYTWKVGDEDDLYELKINTSAILGFSVGQNHSLILGDIVRTNQDYQTAPKMLKHSQSNPHQTSKVQSNNSSKTLSKDLIDTFNKYSMDKQNINENSNYNDSQFQQYEQQQSNYKSSSSFPEQCSMVSSSQNIIRQLINCQKQFQEVKQLLKKSNKIGLNFMKNQGQQKQNQSNNNLNKDKKNIMILRQKDLKISQLQDEISRKQAIILGYQNTMQTLKKMLCIHKMYTKQQI